VTEGFANAVLIVKLSPSEFALFIPNKGDFKKHGGFKLEDDRPVGSYRLKENEKLILCKKKDAQLVTKLTDEDSILVSIKSAVSYLSRLWKRCNSKVSSQEHQAKKMLKVLLSTTIEDLKQQFLKKVTGSAAKAGV